MASPSETNSTPESQSQSESPRSILQRLIHSRNSDLSLFFPLFLGFTLPNPDVNRVESVETDTHPDDHSENHPNPAESTRRQRAILSPGTDPDNNQVELTETETDPDINSVNRPTPDESARRDRIIMLNSLIQPVTDPDGTRVESGETTTDPDTNSANNPSPDESTRRERIILFNTQTQSMVVMEGIGLNAMFHSAEGKSGHPPASKSSVEEMPRVEIGEEDDKGECVICLDEFKVGNIMKKMPCQHGFHENCIEKWLGIHGSCPVCRYQMPVDEIQGKKFESESVEANSEIWVRVSFGRSTRND